MLIIRQSPTQPQALMKFMWTCLNNEIQVNSKKTKFVVFRGNRPRETLPPLWFGGELICPSESVKLLAVILDDRLSFDEHIWLACVEGLLEPSLLSGTFVTLLGWAVLVLSTTPLFFPFCSTAVTCGVAVR